MARWSRPGLWLVAMASGLTMLTAAGPPLHQHFGDWALLAVFAVAGAGAMCASRIGELAGSRSALVIILVGAAAMRLALLFPAPTLSDDIYRYIWDGRVQAAGINPYRYIPAAPELSHLRDPAIWPRINRADYAVTIYPPIAQFLFLGITRLDESVVAMKLGLLLFEASTVAALIALLYRLALPPTRVAAYAWHPLPVWEIAGSGHVDAAMVALLMISLLVCLRGRTLLAGVLATLGALVKPTALLALPVFWRPWDWRLPLVVVATIAVAYLPYLSVGTGVLGFLGTYIEEEGFREGSGFVILWLLQNITGPLPFAAPAYTGFAGLVLATMAVRIGFRTDRSDAAAIGSLSWLVIVFMVLTSPHYPWYFVAVAPFLALRPTLTAWTLTTFSVFLYHLYSGDATPGYATRFTTFTLVTLAALTYDLWGQWPKASRSDGETS